MSLVFGIQSFIKLALIVALLGYLPAADAKKSRRRSPASVGETQFTEDHYKSFSLIAKTWGTKGCEKEVPRKVKTAIEQACLAARADRSLYRPKLRRVSGTSHVQCLKSSETGFLEITMGTKKGGKLAPNQGLAEFKLDPKGNLYAVAQDGHAVGSGYCEELEEEVTTRKSVMGYNTFQALFINQYSPGKRLTADQFFGQIAKVNLCYQHHPNFTAYRCSKFMAKQKQIAREIAAEQEKKKRRKFKHNYKYF